MPSDCAYGGADSRANADVKGVEILAKTPKQPKSERFTKSDFLINLGARTVTCQAYVVTG